MSNIYEGTFILPYLFSVLNYNMFDIVIVVGPKDTNILKKQILYTKKNIIGYRNIYLVCSDLTINVEGCVIIDERIFPFTIEDVAKYHGKQGRNGWYLQQLLKLYAGNTINGILDRYLVIDCDTFFLKPTTFIEDGKCLYNFGKEYHMPYFIHMKKLDNKLKRMDKTKSGICHHMMFETKYLNELFHKIETIHNESFYKVFLKNVVDFTHSGASEYELYFNYMVLNHRDQIKIRHLHWSNVSSPNLETMIKNIERNKDLVYVSYHWYLRK